MFLSSQGIQVERMRWEILQSAVGNRALSVVEETSIDEFRVTGAGHSLR